MKKILLTTISFLITLLSFSQILPEVGAKWTYEFQAWQVNGNEEIIDTNYTFEVLRDTIVNDERVLIVSNIEFNCGVSLAPFLYFTEKNDSVFEYTADFNRKTLLYHLNAQAGDQWNGPEDIIVTVDSISYLVANNDSLKTLHVTYTSADPERPLTAYTPYCSKIIERIGDIRFLENYNQHGDCVGENDSQGLISYKDSTYDLDESYFNQDCEVKVGLRNIKTKNTLSVFPSITSDYLTLTQAEKLEKSTVQILSVSGETLRTFAFTGNEIGISNLTNGVYYLNVSNSEINESLRFVVSR